MVTRDAWRVEPAAQTSEVVRIDCTERGCVVERELAISNARDTAYDGLVLDPLEVWVDGAQGDKKLITDLVADERFGALLRKSCEGMDERKCLLGVGRTTDAPTTAPPWGYATVLRVDPGRTVRVVQRTDLQFSFPANSDDIEIGCPGSVRPAPIHTRHLLFGAWRERRPRVGTAIVAANGPVTITFPSDWTITMAGQGPRTMAPDGSGRAVLQTTAHATIAIERTLPPVSWIRRGGPFIAAGAIGQRGQPDSFRFALRAGYEISNRGWLIYSTAIETNFDRLVVAPVVETALELRKGAASCSENKNAAYLYAASSFSWWSVGRSNP